MTLTIVNPDPSTYYTHTAMPIQTKQDPQELLASTLQRLQQNAERISPVDDLIGQWSDALGEGNLTLENIADELFSLKRAITDAHQAKVASSLHTLSKLTKQAAGESSEAGLVGQLLQLAHILDELSAQASNKT